MLARHAIRCVPGFFHPWSVDILRRALLTSGVPFLHNFVTEEEAHHVFVIGPEGGDQVALSVGNFVMLGLEAAIAAGEIRCTLLDEALPEAAAALEANETCGFLPGVRAVTNAKAAYRQLLSPAGMGLGKVAYRPLLSIADGFDALEEVLRDVDHLLTLDHGTSCAMALRELRVECMAETPRPAISNDLIEGDWLETHHFQIALGAPFFVLGDAPTEPVGANVQVVGPARILVGGPYVFLPRGIVFCELAFSVSQDLAGEAFQVNAYSGSLLLTSRSFAVPAGPTLCARLSFENPCHRTPLDIHLLNSHGAIGGTLQFYGATLSSSPFETPVPAISLSSGDNR